MRPLNLLSNIQTRVQNELVQVTDLVAEARLSVAALLRGAELMLKQGVVLGADDGEIVTHRVAGRIGCALRSSSGCAGRLRGVVVVFVDRVVQCRCNCDVLDVGSFPPSAGSHNIPPTFASANAANQMPPYQAPAAPPTAPREKVHVGPPINVQLLLRRRPSAVDTPPPSRATMFGPFRITNPLSGGLLWKIPWRLSKFQKRRHRLRLRAVDNVVATVDAALAKKGQTLEALERWKAEMPTEAEMLPKDKYTMFDRKAKRYRKGIHSTSFCN